MKFCLVSDGDFRTNSRLEKIFRMENKRETNQYQNRVSSRRSRFAKIGLVSEKKYRFCTQNQNFYGKSKIFDYKGHQWPQLD